MLEPEIDPPSGRLLSPSKRGSARTPELDSSDEESLLKMLSSPPHADCGSSSRPMENRSRTSASTGNVCRCHTRSTPRLLACACLYGGKVSRMPACSASCILRALHCRPYSVSCRLHIMPFPPLRARSAGGLSSLPPRSTGAPGKRPAASPGASQAGRRGQPGARQQAQDGGLWQAGGTAFSHHDRVRDRQRQRPTDRQIDRPTESRDDRPTEEPTETDMAYT
jgi:hypothetical protein